MRRGSGRQNGRGRFREAPRHRNQIHANLIHDGLLRARPLPFVLPGRCTVVQELEHMHHFPAAADLQQTFWMMIMIMAIMARMMPSTRAVGRLCPFGRDSGRGVGTILRPGESAMRGARGHDCDYGPGHPSPASGARGGRRMTTVLASPDGGGGGERSRVLDEQNPGR